MNWTDDQIHQISPYLSDRWANLPSKACPCCGTSFRQGIREHLKRWLNHKYCSRKCYHKIDRIKNGVAQFCANCGKSFYVKPYRKGKSRFCSRKCWTQSNEARVMVANAVSEHRRKNPLMADRNPNWKGGLIPESRLRLTRRKWRLLRLRMLRLYRNTCARCGRKQNLIVHHIKSWRCGGQDTTSNLMVVCSKCHPTIEKARSVKSGAPAIAPESNGETNALFSGTG